MCAILSPSRSPWLLRTLRLACPRIGAALFVVHSGTLAPLDASAQPQPPRASSNGSRPVELRAAISPSAANLFTESRLRRVLAIELRDTAVLAPSLSGPLGDQVGWAWIDLPDPTSVVIEARFGSQPLARRTLSIEGLGREAAARLVAIACAEMLRSLVHPARTRRSGQTKAVCAEQVDLLSRSLPSLVWSAGGHAVLLTSHPTWMVGPGIGLSTRYGRVSAGIFGTWMGGRTQVGTVGWLEGGVGAEYRATSLSSWRVSIGGAAAAASVRLGGVDAVDQIVGQTTSWSARAGGVLRLERRLTDWGWLGLSLEPGAVLRPVGFHTTSSSDNLGGAWLAASIAFHQERSLVGAENH